MAIAKDLKHLKAIVVYGEPVPAGLDCEVPIYSFADFCDLGKSVEQDKIDERINGQAAGECCTLIYTSGTTGNPKAVMISNDNLCWTSATMMGTIDPLGPKDCLVSYLPLSHIAAQMLDMHCPMVSGSQVFFAQPDALRGSLGMTLREVQPTVFFGVPRVWEKIYEKMQAVGKTTKGLKKKIATWAKAKGSKKNGMAQFGAKGGKPAFFGVANKIVFSKIKAILGLEKCIACFTGAAPIELKVLNYFASIDIPIYELFGQSEVSERSGAGWGGG